MDLDREQDAHQLRRIARVQKTQINHLLHVVGRLQEELRQYTGAECGEQGVLLDLEQLQIRAESEAEHAAAKSEKKERKPQKGHGPCEQPQLPRDTELFELDEADRSCPQCGEALSPIEGQYESSEMVDVVDVRYRIVEVKRQKYRCKCGSCVETAIGPERTINGGRYSLRFGVKVAIDKYLDHLPLARQSRILERHGLIASSQTLWDQIDVLAQKLRPTYDKLLDLICKEPVIGLDQTAWPALDQKNKKWQMWCLTAPTLIYHQICDDKGADTFGKLIGNYDGTIVCDALSTHGAGAREGPRIVLSGCWAHITRKFREAEQDFPRAQIAQDLIRELYDLDVVTTIRSDSHRGVRCLSNQV